MTKEQLIQEIQTWIIANGNNEITANVLRPILEEMVYQPNDLIGDLTKLATNDKRTLVYAINEAAQSGGEAEGGGITIHVGTVAPENNTDITYETGHFYLQYDTAWVAFYQYNGNEWVPIKKLQREDVITVLGFEPLNSGGYAGTGQELMNYINAINGVLDVDDTTLDELREIVAYIQQNRQDLQNLSVSNIAGLQTALDGKEDTFTKNTAFNKNFGTAAGTVAEGNHTHSADQISETTSRKWVSQTEKDTWNNKLDSESDPTVPAHVKAITQADIDSWNAGGDIDLSKYLRVDAGQTFTEAEKTQGRTNLRAQKKSVIREVNANPTTQNLSDWNEDTLLISGDRNIVLPAASALPDEHQFAVKTSANGTVQFSLEDATVSIEYNDVNAIGYMSQRTEAWVFKKGTVYYVNGEVT